VDDEKYIQTIGHEFSLIMAFGILIYHENILM
jgi:hypothetical protein